MDRDHSLGIPETSLSGRSTRTALSVRRSTGMFMCAPAVARILRTHTHTQTHTHTHSHACLSTYTHRHSYPQTLTHIHICTHTLYLKMHLIRGSFLSFFTIFLLCLLLIWGFDSLFLLFSLPLSLQCLCPTRPHPRPWVCLGPGGSTRCVWTAGPPNSVSSPAPSWV